MIKKSEIKKEIQKQVRNYKKIQFFSNINNFKNGTKFLENSQELMDSINGTEQRKAILTNTNEKELYDMYMSELENTSNMIFSENSTDTEKILNALEYMRITVNSESEKINNIDDISISGINSALLGEGNEASQNSYFRDLLKLNNIDASKVIVDYTNESGETSKKELVKIQLQDGQAILVSPTEYNGSLASIEKFSNQDYTDKSGFFEKFSSLFQNKNLLSENFKISDDDIAKSRSFIHSKLIDKYNINEISQLAGLDSTSSADNQLKILGLIGNNLTPIQSNNSELFRSVRMNDGKEIEVSKLLELFYSANGIEYTPYLGETKDSSFFEFTENGSKYTICPDSIFRKTQGDNIDTSAIFTSDDIEQTLKSLSGNEPPNDSLDQCQATMNSKVRNSFLNVRDFNISDLQNVISENPESLDLIKKNEQIKHYSIDDISFQLGLKDLLNSGDKNDALKAHTMLMAYLNSQSFDYTYNNEKYQFITLSDGKCMSVSDVQELFFLQNNIEYRKDDKNNLIFKIGDKEYSWQFNYNALLTNEAVEADLLSYQSLTDVTTNQKTSHPILTSSEIARVRGVIDLSKRIPTSPEEIAILSDELSNINNELESIPQNYQIDNQLEILNYRTNYTRQNSSNEYNDYISSKPEKQEFYSQSDEEKLQNYKQKVEDVANAIASSCKSDEDKILTTLEYIRLSGRYENITEYSSLNVAAALSQNGISYALTGEGVCASQAQYTRDILNALGFKADVQSCNTDYNTNIARADVSNHLITTVTVNGKQIAIDPTNYNGTIESLDHSNAYSMTREYSQYYDIMFAMQREGKSDEEINEALSKLSQSDNIRDSISAEVYPRHLLDMRIRTLFGSKTLQEANFSSLETTDEKISEARKKAGDILISEFGIDEISDSLNINQLSDDTQKQSLAFGFIENNLLPLESYNRENILSRIVRVGDKTLELNDFLELFYMQNDIDYDIIANHCIGVNINNENVEIDTASAYKNGLSNEEERNLLFHDVDGTFLELSPYIEQSIQDINRKMSPNKSFADKYKVDGVDCKINLETISETTKELSKDDGELEDDPRLSSRYMH